MAVRDAAKFFEDNFRYIEAKQDPVMFNLTSGLLKLVQELDAELRSVKNDLDEMRRQR
jgi:hypothetical protein